jgi:hypothetical protein
VTNEEFLKDKCMILARPWGGDLCKGWIVEDGQDVILWEKTELPIFAGTAELAVFTTDGEDKSHVSLLGLVEKHGSFAWYLIAGEDQVSVSFNSNDPFLLKFKDNKFVSKLFYDPELSAKIIYNHKVVA